MCLVSFPLCVCKRDSRNVCCSVKKSKIYSVSLFFIYKPMDHFSKMKYCKERKHLIKEDIVFPPRTRTWNFVWLQFLFFIQFLSHSFTSTRNSSSLSLLSCNLFEMRKWWSSTNEAAVTADPEYVLTKNVSKKLFYCQFQ